ncbi:MAG TPA: hypothetical protein VF175_19400 [Lacipirellula sp.]
MSPRLKLRSALTPLVMAGALWVGDALTPVLGAGHGPIVNRGGAQTPPPCSPDGVCVPRPQTFGVYQTRWRTFPGDVPVPAPTEAEVREEEAREELGGPQPPAPKEEGLMGPTPMERGGAEEAEGAPAEGDDPAAAGLGTLPGEAPLGGFELPSVTPPGGEAAPGVEGAAPPDNGLQLPPAGTEPGAADPLDPFGNAPPAPPAWISSAAHGGAPQQATSPLPVIEHAAVIQTAPAPVAPPADLALPAATNAAPTANAPAIGPAPPVPTASVPVATPAPLEIQTPASAAANLYAEDAPPVLPPALAASAGIAARADIVPASATAAPVIQQPPSVEPIMIDDQVIVDDRVEAASAEEPIGIQLVNPAGALVDPSAQGPQQAIYFEASDQ